MYQQQGQQPPQPGATSMMATRASTVILKVRLGNDIRKIPIHNADLTYDDLVLMLQRVFGPTGRLPKDDFTIKYEDEDGDLITMVDNQDLHLATMSSATVRLTICADAAVSSIDSASIDNIHRQLQNVCVSVNDLVRRLDQVAGSVTGGHSGSGTAGSTSGTRKPSASTDASNQATSMVNALARSASQASTRATTPKTTNPAVSVFDPIGSPTPTSPANPSQGPGKSTAPASAAASMPPSSMAHASTPSSMPSSSMPPSSMPPSSMPPSSMPPSSMGYAPGPYQSSYQAYSAQPGMPPPQQPQQPQQQSQQQGYGSYSAYPTSSANYGSYHPRS